MNSTDNRCKISGFRQMEQPKCFEFFLLVDDNLFEHGNNLNQIGERTVVRFDHRSVRDRISGITYPVPWHFKVDGVTFSHGHLPELERLDENDIGVWWEVIRHLDAPDSANEGLVDWWFTVVLVLAFLYPRKTGQRHCRNEEFAYLYNVVTALEVNPSRLIYDSYTQHCVNITLGQISNQDEWIQISE